MDTQRHDDTSQSVSTQSCYSGESTVFVGCDPRHCPPLPIMPIYIIKIRDFHLNQKNIYIFIYIQSYAVLAIKGFMQYSRPVGTLLPFSLSRFLYSSPTLIFHSTSRSPPQLSIYVYIYIYRTIKIYTQKHTYVHVHKLGSLQRCKISSVYWPVKLFIKKKKLNSVFALLDLKYVYTGTKRTIIYIYTPKQYYFITQTRIPKNIKNVNRTFVIHTVKLNLRWV